jgi:hypothetical protein
MAAAVHLFLRRLDHLRVIAARELLLRVFQALGARPRSRKDQTTAYQPEDNRHQPGHGQKGFSDGHVGTIHTLTSGMNQCTFFCFGRGERANKSGYSRVVTGNDFRASVILSMTDPLPTGEYGPELDQVKIVESISRVDPAKLPPGSAANSANAGTPVTANKLTPEEQMALYEKELKENDWGHQPC